MSKTVDDLVKVYIEAFDAMKALEDWPNDSFPDGTCERAGIAAVVRALRDELIPEHIVGDERYSWTHELRRKFNKFLASDAGNEKVAGSTPEGAVLSSSAKGEPPASPATAPAPAVCVWTKDGHWYWQHGLYSDRPNLGAYCPSCGLPIKFTEAK